MRGFLWVTCSDDCPRLRMEWKKEELRLKKREKKGKNEESSSPLNAISSTERQF